ncbi:long chronological lifespan protein 2 [Apiospora arundinis]
MRSLISILLLALFSATASAQFGFFDQMFGGGGGGGGGQQQQARQQQQRQQQNVPSDSSLYQQNYDHYPCENYLMRPLPTPLPCPFPANEDKFETGDGHRLCVSKGGFKAGEAARKVELARKGLL